MKNRIFVAVVSLVVALAAVTAATLAWFTDQSTVSTSRVTATVADGDVRLEISETGGGAFKPLDEPGIPRLAGGGELTLFPVSTADLQTFVRSLAATEERASEFALADGEDSYFHGRIYLRASGLAEGKSLALYFDEGAASGGPLAVNSSGSMLDGARLGILLDGKARIFSGAPSGAEGGLRHTYLDGRLLEADEVLTWRDGAPAAAADPSVPLSDYCISYGGDGAVRLPSEPLALLKPGEIVPVDVFFYLEGCDPDCGNSLMLSEADLHLAFFGVVTD